MNRTRFACVVVCSAVVLLDLSSVDAIGQQPAPTASPWTITFKTDPMTDKPVYTAVELSASDDGLYELTFKCDGKGRTVTIATFTATQEARPIPFTQSALIPALGETHSFRYRIDDEQATGGLMKPAGYYNVGRLEWLDAIFKQIPVKRLVIADVFPDENVQFAFTGLTPEQRDQMEQMCFSSERGARTPSQATSPANREGARGGANDATRADKQVQPSPPASGPLPKTDTTWRQVEGASPERVRQLVGNPSLTGTVSGVPVWYYDGTTFGTVKVYFPNGIASLDAPSARP